MKYRIKIKETLSKVVEVEADDYDSAFEKVEEMVNCEEVVLTADDFDSVLHIAYFSICSIKFIVS